MKRKKLSYRKSKRMFRNTASKVHKLNLPRHRRRGGFCL